MSIKWCGIPFCSSGVGFAAAMLNPLYTSLESADTISPLILSARLIAKSVLPLAVGPTTAITFGLIFLFYRKIKICVIIFL